MEHRLTQTEFAIYYDLYCREPSVFRTDLMLASLRRDVAVAAGSKDAKHASLDTYRPRFKEDYSQNEDRIKGNLARFDLNRNPKETL